MKVLFYDGRCAPGGISTFIENMYGSLEEVGIDSEAYFERDLGDFARLSNFVPAHLGSTKPLGQLLSEHHFDVIHTTLASSNTLLRKKLRRIRWRGRVVVTAQGVVIPGWHSKNCFAITSVNSKHAAELEALTDLEVEVVYNGVDVSRFRPLKFDGGKPIVAWIGRASDIEQKRFDVFANVAPFLHREGFRLWIADPEGSNVLTPELRDRVLPYVSFWDRVPREQVPRFFGEVGASGGCVISTASYEGLSYALIEAQACGCPVVAARAVGIDEGVREEFGGTLYPPSLDPSGIGKLLLKLLFDTEGMSEQRRKCRAFVVREFQQAEITRKYLEIYRRPAQLRTIEGYDSPRQRQRARNLIAETKRQSWSFREDLDAVESAIAIDPTQKWNPKALKVYATSLIKKMAFPAVKHLRGKRASRV